MSNRARSWFCRLAERAEFADHLDERPGAPTARRGIWGSLVARHVDRCPECRSERAANERLVRMLKETKGPPAPPSLLPAVMARIAAERAELGAKDARAFEAQQGARRPRKAGSPADRMELGAALWFLALLCGWAGFVSASDWLVGFMPAAPAVAESAMAIIRSHAGQAISYLRMGAGASYLGLEPYVTAFFWSVVGLGTALWVPMLLESVNRAGDE